MSFTTRRGRPKHRLDGPDLGTAELRRKQAAGFTAEPIDLLLSRALISEDQHWCGLHLRWLYTLRYGAPSLTSRYLADQGMPTTPQACEQWRAGREREYHDACTLLRERQRYDCVLRLSVFNELPVFLNPLLQERAFTQPALATKLLASHQRLREGLDLLVAHWRHGRTNPAATEPPQSYVID